MKLTITLVNLFFLLQIIQAQSLELKIHAGYGFSLSSETLGEGVTVERDQTRVRSVISHSNGRGLNYNIGMYYSIYPQIQIGTSVSILRGLNKTYYSLLQTRQTYTSYKGQMIRLIPSVKFNQKIKEISLYTELGLIFGFNGKVIAETDYSDEHWDIEIQNRIKEYRGRVSIGATFGLGVKKIVRRNLSLFSEFRIFSQGLSIKESEVVQFTQNGEDVIDELATWSRYGEYLKEHTDVVDGISGQDTNMPFIGLAETRAFSSIGVNLGIIYIFNKKRNED